MPLTPNDTPAYPPQPGKPVEYAWGDEVSNSIVRQLVPCATTGVLHRSETKNTILTVRSTTERRWLFMMLSSMMRGSQARRVSRQCDECHLRKGRSRNRSDTGWRRRARRGRQA